MIKYSIETVYHFQCQTCRNWWSIGDFTGNPMSREMLSCPYCRNTAVPEDFDDDPEHREIDIPA